MPNRERQGDFFIFGSALLWGLFPVITILSYTNLAPMLSLGWSTIFAGIFFAATLTARRRWQEIRNRSALRDILLGTFLIGVLYYVFFFWGLEHTSAGNASIIALLEIFFSYLFFNIWRKEYMSWRHVSGTMLMAAGALLVLYPNFSEFRMGDFIILVGVAFAPLGNLFQRRAREKVSSETIMFVRSAIAGPVILLMAYLLGSRFSAAQFQNSFLFLLINGALLLGLSKIFWIEGIHRISITKANALSVVSPLFTLLFAWLILHDQPSAWQISALLPMFAGIVLLSSNGKTEAIPNSPEQKE